MLPQPLTKTAQEIFAPGRPKLDEARAWGSEIERAIGFGARPRLGANLTVYFRSDGNNDNDGLEDSPGRAKQTPQAAAMLAASFDLNQKTLTIQHGVESGLKTFTTGMIVNGLVGGGTLKIRGNGDAATALIPASGVTIDVQHAGNVNVVPENMLVANTAGTAIKASYLSLVSLGAGLHLGACPSGFRIHVHDGQAIVQILNELVKFSGNAVAGVFCQNGGHCYIEGSTPKAIGAVDHSDAFFLGYPAGSMQYIGSPPNEDDGAFTGKPYNIFHQSVMNKNGAADSTMPGDDAGVADASSVVI